MQRPEIVRDSGALRALLDDYRVDCQARGLSSRTVNRNYCWPISGLFLPWCEEQRITEPGQLDQAAINRWTVYLHATGSRGRAIQPSTIRAYIESVNKWLRWLRRVGETDRELAGHRPRLPRRMVEVLEQHEIDAMRAAARYERDRLVVDVLWETGMRASELLCLRVGDLVERGGKGGFRILAPDAGGGAKGGRERWVPAPDTIRPLRRFLALQRDRVPGSDHVWLTLRRDDRGHYQRLSLTGLEAMLEHLGLDAGIKRRVHPHLFRHSWATRMLRGGMNPVAAAQILGHSSLAMIQQVYAHLSPEDVWEQLARVTRAPQGR